MPRQNKRVIIPINQGSDGDPSKWPVASVKLQAVNDDESFRIRVGNLWQRDRGGVEPGNSACKHGVMIFSITTKLGTTYMIDRLPAGYRIYSQSRTNKDGRNANHVSRKHVAKSN